MYNVRNYTVIMVFTILMYFYATYSGSCSLLLLSKLVNIILLFCDMLYLLTDQTLDVANEYIWRICKPRLSDLVINFNIWNFTDKVRRS